MLRMKPLILGLVTSVIIFLLLLCGMSFAAKSFGFLSSSSYLLAMEFFSAIGVLVGAFVASRCAWERGALYGLVVAIGWILLRVILVLVLGGQIIYTILLVKGAILLLVGLSGGAFGVNKRQQKMI